DAVPALIIDGTADTVTNYFNSTEFVNALQAAGDNVTYQLYPGYTHGQFTDTFASSTSEQNMMTAWLKSVALPCFQRPSAAEGLVICGNATGSVYPEPLPGQAQARRPAMYPSWTLSSLSSTRRSASLPGSMLPPCRSQPAMRAGVRLAMRT